MLSSSNISEIKKEYTNFLLDTITPHIYEGISTIYKTSTKQHENILLKTKNSLKASPGILKIFQMQLKEIPNINSHKIEAETNRIKEACKCSEWFDNLVKAVVKSNIMLLTMESERFMNLDYHEDISIPNFIHKCYIECAKNFYTNPNVFWHEYDSTQLKDNQRIIVKTIRKCIKNAIRKMLPIGDILLEYNQQNQKSKDEVYNLIKESVCEILDKDYGIATRGYKSETSERTQEEDIKMCKIDINKNYDTEKIFEKSSPAKDEVLSKNVANNIEVKVKSNVVPPIEKDEKYQKFLQNNKSDMNIILDVNNANSKKAKNKIPEKSNKEQFFSQYF